MYKKAKYWIFISNILYNSDYKDEPSHVYTVDKYVKYYSKRHKRWYESFMSISDLNNNIKTGLCVPLIYGE